MTNARRIREDWKIGMDQRNVFFTGRSNKYRAAFMIVSWLTNPIKLSKRLKAAKSR